MSPGGRRRLSLLLMLFCVGQALIVAAALLRPAGIPAADDGAGTAAVPELPAAAPLASFAETTARPLFLATRTELPAAGAPAGSALILGRYAFVGAMTAPGRSIVLLSPVDGGQTLRLREGEALDGWTVREIGADFLRLERDGDVNLVPLVKP